MKLSLNWIQNYIDLNGIPVEDLVKRLTLSTCEVEEVLHPFSDLDQLIVGRVESLQKHPDADRLSVCQVHDGKSTVQVICGAPNVRQGIHILFAPVGASIGDPEQPLKIEKRKIRGVESSGMICAASEVGLELLFPDREGILILDDEEFMLQKGAVSPADFLGQPVSALIPVTDTVLDIDNKSITHRPDLWCHFGFAREIAAIYRRKLKYNPLETRAPSASKGVSGYSLDIRNQAALGYSGLSADGIRVGPSPLWLRASLASVGQKSINNIVDASNFVMLELAQPNHAFDRSKLECETIVIDLARKTTQLETLDEQNTEVPAESILILTEGRKSRPVALGGIIGGRETAISEETTEIFLESATFPRERIRRTLSHLDLRTDSAVRFEKGQDPAKMVPSLHRLAEIISILCPEAKFGKVNKSGDVKGKKSSIKASLPFLRSRLGFEISEVEVRETLEWLGFEVKGSSAAKNAEKGKSGSAKKANRAEKKSSRNNDDVVFTFIAPTYRSQYDISIPEDIIEELGRIYGYDNIPQRAPSPELKATPASESRMLERLIKQSFRSHGFYETMGYSFCSEKENEAFGQEGLRILNPVNASQGRMRLSQIPGILKQAALNQNRFDTVRLLELGRVFVPPEKIHKGDPERNLPTENGRLTLLALPDQEKSSAESPAFQEFLTVRSALEAFLVSLNLRYRLAPSREQFYLHPGCQLEIVLEEQPHPASGSRNHVSRSSGLPSEERLGFGGMVHPAYANQYELKRPGVLFDLDFDVLLKWVSEASRRSYYEPPGNQPDSLFEFTVVLNQEDSTARPVQIVNYLSIPEVKDISLKTIYRGAPLQPDEMAVSYRVRASRRNETLSGKESQKILETIVEALQAESIPLRS